jgi:hypothetical protein
MPIDQYNKMMEQLEEIDDIRAYDAAKAEEDEVIPFDQAVNEIEAWSPLPAIQLLLKQVQVFVLGYTCRLGVLSSWKGHFNR